MPLLQRLGNDHWRTSTPWALATGFAKKFFAVRVVGCFVVVAVVFVVAAAFVVLLLLVVVVVCIYFI